MRSLAKIVIITISQYIHGDSLWRSPSLEERVFGGDSLWRRHSLEERVSGGDSLWRRESLGEKAGTWIRDTYCRPHQAVLRELHVHHQTIMYLMYDNASSEARLHGVSSLIQPCHIPDYEEDTRRTNKKNYIDFGFFSLGY